MPFRNPRENVDAETGEIPDEQAVSEDEAGRMLASGFLGGNFPIEVAEDPLAIQKSIVARVFQATSLDELFGVWEAKTSDQLEDMTVKVLDAEFSTYTPVDGNGPMPLARVTYESNDKQDTFITTSPNLTSFIAQAQNLQALPFTAKIVGSRTRSGQTALHFERVR
jgi:hypothetical protein